MTHFRDEAERLRAREAVARIGYVLDVPLGLQGVFDRLYPRIVDAPEDGMDTTMPDNGHFMPPTPPDFDAAVEEYAKACYMRARNWMTPIEAEATARQRVRELYEAVVRERDNIKSNFGLTLNERIRLEEQNAALRAAQGEEMEIVGHRYHTDGRPTLTVAGLYGEQFQTGDRVRVVKVVEGA